MATTTQELHELLKPTSTTAERVRGLLELLPASELARSTGVTVSALRNWGSGDTEPRPDAAIALDDLRHAAVILLLQGNFDPKRVSSWLKSRDCERLPDDMRPVDLVRTEPLTVLSAAHGEVLNARMQASTS